MGGDLGGTGGRSPQNFEVGTAHASVPTIFGEVLLRDLREKYEVNNKKWDEEIFCETEVFR